MILVLVVAANPPEFYRWAEDTFDLDRLPFADLPNGLIKTADTTYALVFSIRHVIRIKKHFPLYSSIHTLVLEGFWKRHDAPGLFASLQPIIARRRL